MAGDAKQQTIFALHTSFALIELLGALYKEKLPAARVVNIVDDSLLADVRAAGRVTPSVARRMIGYATLAQSSGADAVFNCCSSVGEVADMLRQTLDIPVVKIDEAMGEQAVAAGRRVAVVATVATTLDPTVRLIESKARAAGRTIEVSRRLADGAFDVLLAGDAARHDEMVLEEIRSAAREADVVVLAQASMSRLVNQLGDLQARVLSSPASGVERLKQVLQKALAASS